MFGPICLALGYLLVLPSHAFVSNAELGLDDFNALTSSRSSIYSLKAAKRDRLAKRDSYLRWCGKHYQVGSPADSEEVYAGLFSVPEISSAPMLDFRCTPVIQPYLHDETDGAFLIDANVTYDVGVPFASSSSQSLNDTLVVTISLSNSSTTLLSNVTISVGSTGNVIPFSLSSIAPSPSAYTISCFAMTSSNQTFTSESTLYKLPENPYIINSTSVATRIDRRSGAMLRFDDKSAEWKPFIPYGFYTGFSDLIANLSIVDQMADDGFNVIHIVPPYENTTVIQTILDRADAADIMYMADFRDIYENLTEVEPYVEIFRNRSNLLAWYTNDEPDGTADPSNYTAAAYELFYEMDGYHPVSLVLNCLDFYWSNYTSGADIVFADVYPIAVNTTFSKEYDTVCNFTYGCCGCDDCTGSLTDIPNKIELWSDFRRYVGRTRTLPIWNVPQAFNGTDEFWDRVPTGAEFKMQTVLGINHGAVGVMPWDNPYDTPSIAQGAREISPIFSSLSSGIVALILNANATRTLLEGTDALDAARWSVPGQDEVSTVLVLITSLVYENSTVEVDVTAGGLEGTNLTLVQTVFGNEAEEGASIEDGVVTITLGSTEVAGFVFTNATA